jgi:hypothetical protein
MPQMAPHIQVRMHVMMTTGTIIIHIVVLEQESEGAPSGRAIGVR